MLGRQLPKNKKFSFEPRYWDKKKEEKEGRRIQFKRTLSKSAAKKRSSINLFIVVAIVVYLFYFLSRMGR